MYELDNLQKEFGIPKLKKDVQSHTGYIDMHEVRLRKLEALHDSPAEGLAAEGHNEAILNVVLRLLKKHGK